MTKKNTLKVILFIGILEVLAVIVFVAVANAGTFIEDLGDSTKNTCIGREVFQGGICALGGFSGAMLMKGAKREDLWWVPAAWLTAGFVFLHVPYFIDGGENSKLAFRETMFEGLGAFLGGSVTLIEF